MHLYLVEVKSSTDKSIPARYKTGQTKWGPKNIIQRRFRYNDDYDGLDVELLATKRVQRPSALEARQIAESLEDNVFEQIPRKEWGVYDNIEEYFGIPQRAKSFGCTEFHHKDLNLSKEELITKWISIVDGERYE